ncbi:MAG TPA: LuxR C-terminal-related transcriptional regulator [Anaerolineales bacterium]|nr:LuxR C-terminal-related transcriptional regulator [Anaerolineales bacterium]
MSIWQRLLNLIGLRPKSGSRTYEISESLQVTLATLAKHEGRPEDELLPDILAAGLNQYVSKDKLWNRWNSLTAREQDVAALACLGYTNREIGRHLNISPETVKVRLQRAMMKFGVTTRSQLRMLLEEWDFSEWEKPKYRK